MESSQSRASAERVAFWVLRSVHLAPFSSAFLGDPGSFFWLYHLICLVRVILPRLQRGYLDLNFPHQDHKWQQPQQASKPSPSDAGVWFSATRQPHEKTATLRPHWNLHTQAVMATGVDDASNSWWNRGPALLKSSARRKSRFSEKNFLSSSNFSFLETIISSQEFTEIRS